MEIFRTPFQQNIPQAFSYVDFKGHTRLAGPYAQTIKYFAEYQHYEFQYVPIERMSISAVQKEIQNGFYNISMHGVGMNNSFANISFSYPIEWVRVCIIVPAEKELPRFWYVVLPFGTYIWTTVCVLVIFVAILMRCLRHPSTSLSRNLLKSMAVITYSSNMNLKIVNASRKLQFFYTLLFLMGFVLNSYYCSYLPGYNMKPIFQPFLNTVEQLRMAKLQVLISSPILEELRASPSGNLFKLGTLLVEKPRSEVKQSIQNFSLAFGYVVTLNDWIFMRKMQRQLIQPLYHLTDMCSPSKYNTYAIPNNAKFADRLNYFLLLVQQSGLWDFWQEEAFLAAIQAQYYKMPRDDYPLDPLNLNYYRFAWIVLFGGNILASFCAMAEMAVHKRWCRTERERSQSITSLIQQVI